jgi:DNA modification methylase
MLKKPITNISELTQDPDNARRHTEANLSMLERSLEELGAARSIVIDEAGTILAGNATIEAAANVGIENVKVVEADGNTIIAVQRLGLTPEQKTRLALYDNRVAELAQWNPEVLAELAKTPALEGLFSEDALKELLKGLAPAAGAANPDDVPEVEAVPALTQLGDIYTLGRHRLLCDDATSPEAISRLMAGAKADMVITDPPYGMALDTQRFNNTPCKDGCTYTEYEPVIGDGEDFKPELISTIFTHFGYCKEIYLWGADYYAELIPERKSGAWLVWDKKPEGWEKAFGGQFELCWLKQTHRRSIARILWQGFFGTSGEDIKQRIHPTQKPVSLTNFIFDNWGAGHHNIVDLYGGSGTNLIACEATGRACFMMELAPRYCDVIVSRWEAYTGLKAELTPGTPTQ